MKICHCIQTTEEEKDALHITRAILEELENDDMLSHDFEDENGIAPDEIRTWLDNVIAYIEKW